MLARAAWLPAAGALLATAPAALASLPPQARGDSRLLTPRRSPLLSTSTRAQLPPDLVALAEKMEELRVSSERIRLRTFLSAAGAHLPKEAASVLRLFDIDLSGEVATSPRAAALKLTILGHTFTARVVQGRAYLYEPAIAKRDGGRPWIEFGRGSSGDGLGISGLLSGAGPTSFKALARALAGARSATELGPGTVDGQAVVGFKASVDPGLLEEASPPLNAKPKGILGPIGLGSAAGRAPPSVLVEVFIAPSGLPVQTRLVGHEEGVSIDVLFEIFAVDFPLTVQAPPKRQTIAAGALRKLARERRGGSRPARRAETEDGARAGTFAK